MAKAEQEVPTCCWIQEFRGLNQSDGTVKGVDKRQIWKHGTDKYSAANGDTLRDTLRDSDGRCSSISVPLQRTQVFEAFLSSTTCPRETMGPSRHHASDDPKPWTNGEARARAGQKNN